MDPLARVWRKTPSADGGPFFNGLRTLREMGKDQQLLHPDLVPFLAPAMLLGTYEEAQGNLGRIRSPPWTSRLPPFEPRRFVAALIAGTLSKTASVPSGKAWLVVSARWSGTDTASRRYQVSGTHNAVRTHVFSEINAALSGIQFGFPTAQNSARHMASMPAESLMLFSSLSAALIIQIDALAGGTTATCDGLLLEFDESSLISIGASAGLVTLA